MTRRQWMMMPLGAAAWTGAAAAQTGSLRIKRVDAYVIQIGNRKDQTS